MVERIRIVHYNNKSRKGFYIGIHTGKGRERILKYEPGTPVDLYINYARSGKKWTALRKDVKEWNKKGTYQQEYIKKIKSSGQLNKQFIAGHKSYKTDLRKLGLPGELKKLYNRILGGLVLDKKLLPLIMANRTKLKKWFTHTIEVHTEKGHVVDFLDVGKRLPEDIYTSYYSQRNYRKGTIINKEKILNDSVALRVKKSQITIKGVIGYGNEAAPITKVFVTTTYQVG